MSFVISAPATPASIVHGDSALFPLNRIHCLERNCVEHVVEIAHTGREAPFFFLKPADAVLPVAQGSIRRMAGGLIFTGTPEGVTAVAVGDRLNRLNARLEGLGSLDLEIVAVPNPIP